LLPCLCLHDRKLHGFRAALREDLLERDTLGLRESVQCRLYRRDIRPSLVPVRAREVVAEGLTQGAILHQELGQAANAGHHVEADEAPPDLVLITALLAQFGPGVEALRLPSQCIQQLLAHGALAHWSAGPQGATAICAKGDIPGQRAALAGGAPKRSS